MVCAGFAEEEGISQGWGSVLGISRWAAGFVQVQPFLNPSGQNGLTLMCLLFVCLFTYFSGLRSLEKCCKQQLILLAVWGRERIKSQKPIVRAELILGF